ncbi:MAG: tetratricopeptide repeat protein [Planctomycetes bacterium]|nr:tetratricopeptide repeat protein [Planctomycetota bacterium]
MRAKLEHDQALVCFQQALELEPESLDALMGMAWCYKWIDRLDRSIESMRQAYQHHPDVSVVLYNLACYYALDRNLEQALSWLGRALRMDCSLAKLIPGETDFDSLRNDPAFRHLLELSAVE